MSESTGGRPSTEYDLSVDMAKQICMIQRSEKGRLYRQYFIDLEKAWNTPEQKETEWYQDKSYQLVQWWQCHRLATYGNVPYRSVQDFKN